MSSEAQGRAAAEEYRDRHGLGDQPLGDLIALIDRLEDIDVAVITSPHPHGHGMTVCDPSAGSVMLMAVATDHPMRLRSTIAHELGHHLFKDASSNELSAHLESRANAFARHLLLPLGALRKLTPAAGTAEPFGLEDLSEVVQAFALSPYMAAIQFHEADLIDAATKEQWIVKSAPLLATTYGWSSQYRMWQQDSSTPRPPQRLLARAVAGYRQGLVSLATLARMQSITEEEAQTNLDEAGITVTPLKAEVGKVPAADPDDVERALADLDALFGSDG